MPGRRLNIFSAGRSGCRVTVVTRKLVGFVVSRPNNPWVARLGFVVLRPDKFSSKVGILLAAASRKGRPMLIRSACYPFSEQNVCAASLRACSCYAVSSTQPSSVPWDGMCLRRVCGVFPLSSHIYPVCPMDYFKPKRAPGISEAL